MDIHERLQASLSAAYTIDRELAGGGMSRVFLAEERALGRKVVVKLLPVETAAAVGIDRFKREISVAARLQHPHIVPLLSAGEIQGQPYFTMPFVEGATLRDHLSRNGPMPIADAVRRLREIALALAYAHERGIVHRDIKPENILLSGGTAMVTDFGVAKALAQLTDEAGPDPTEIGIALGTPSYMSPEQVAADPNVDQKSDIYSWGILAYELLAGRTPFHARSRAATLAAHVGEAPPSVLSLRSDTPPALANLVMQCLAKAPDMRPASAAALVEHLDGLHTGPSTAAPLGRQWMGALILAGAVIAGGIGAHLFLDRRSATLVDPIRSIAVRPIANIRGDTAIQYVTTGTTDEIMSALAKIPGVRIASRSLTNALGDRDARALGKALDVGAVFEASMRREGEEYVLFAQLIQVTDGLSVWSDTYRARNSAVMQDSIVRAIAGALKVTLTPEQEATIANSQTRSAKAHDLYLRGRFAQSLFTRESLEQSIKYFEAALAEDTTYAAAWSGIADTWGMLADDFVPPREAVANARAARARGVSVDSENPALLSSMATGAMLLEKDLPRALRLYERSLTADPTLVQGRQYYLFALALSGQMDSARAMARRMAADSIEPAALGNAAGFAFYYAGDTALGREICSASRAERDFTCRIYTREASGRYAEELAVLDSVENQTSEPRQKLQLQMIRVGVLAKMGKVREARALAAQVDRDARAMPYYREDVVASMWASVGDAGRALHWLEKGKVSQSGGIPLLYLQWRQYEVRKDPRIAAFIHANAVGRPLPGW